MAGYQTLDSFRSRNSFISVLVALVLTSSTSLAQQNPSGLNAERKPILETLFELRRIGPQTVAPIDQKPTKSLEELRMGQLEWRDRIRNIMVRFDSEVLPMVKSQGSADGFEYATEPTRFRVTYAEKGRKRRRDYKQLGSFSARGKSNRSRNLEFDQLLVYNGTDFREYNFSSRAGQLQKLPRQNISDVANMLFEMLSMSADDDGGQAFRKFRFYVPTALKMSSYSILPQLESVDGFPCHVIVSDLDAIWIDAQNGCSVRRRAWFLRTSEEDPGALSNLYMCRNFREVAAGVWLPFECTRVDFSAQSADEFNRGKVASRNEFTVSEWNINEVPDSLFEFDFPAGSIVYNQDNHTEFFAPAGEKAFADAVKNAGQIKGVSLPGEKIGQMRSGKSPLWIVLANIVLVLILCFLLIAKFLRKRASG